MPNDPDLPTIITDLYNRTSRRILGAGTVGASTIQQQATLSGMYRVQEQATAVMLTKGGGPDNNYSMVASTVLAGNAFCLFFEDQWSTLATVTRDQRVVAGGGYSGCLYSVYDAGGGAYKCIHTARPSGTMADEYVKGLRRYAADKRWTLIHEVPTVADAQGGAGVNGCVTTYLVTRVDYTVVPKPTVSTVRLRHDNQGNSVRADRWDTPTP